VTGRALSILVAGGYDLKDPATLARPLDEVSAFAGVLGGEIVQRGHTLLTGCRTDLDAGVARGAATRLTEAKATDREICDRIISYVNLGVEPAHDVGSIRHSELADWELGGSRP
jgi:hypothetical protein